MKQLQVQKQQEKLVISILMMRFELNPDRAIPIVKKWLRENPFYTWSDLTLMLQQGKITFKKGILQKVEPVELVKLVKRINCKREGIKLKKRWFNFKLYSRTFLGSQLVAWLTKNAGMNKTEAISIGQRLIACGIINPINGYSSFEDKDVYYCFFQKRTATFLDEKEIEAFLIFGTIA